MMGRATIDTQAAAIEFHHESFSEGIHTRLKQKPYGRQTSNLSLSRDITGHCLYANGTKTQSPDTSSTHSILSPRKVWMSFLCRFSDTCIIYGPKHVLTSTCPPSLPTEVLTTPLQSQRLIVIVFQYFFATDATTISLKGLLYVLTVIKRCLALR